MRPLDEHISPQSPKTYCSQNQTRDWEIFNDFGDDDEREHPELYQNQEGEQVAPGASLMFFWAEITNRTRSLRTLQKAWNTSTNPELFTEI